ncbi:MAG: hypothetical protein OQL06_00785 [Gammaproteobacteria bacterium]|nr:hypothetical protein [Gammaproteobacteria bacterium]
MERHINSYLKLIVNHSCMAFRSIRLYAPTAKPLVLNDKSFIANKFPHSGSQTIAYREELIRVCEQFVESGFADKKFTKELTSGKDEKFWSCISEALIFNKLKDKAFSDRPKKGKGPDFLILNGDKRVWIEVICPKPNDIPESWLNFEIGVTDFPHEQILLRWTAAIKEKAEKLIGKENSETRGYLYTGIVEASDSYVIAVNGCQLRHGPFSTLTGISQFPFAAEAVFPIGPIQIKISKDSMEITDQWYQHRPFIINKNNSEVPAYTFLVSRYSHISAIWAVDLNGGSVIGNTEAMSIIHNPNAVNPIPLGFLPSDSEYTSKPYGHDEIQVYKVENTYNNQD